MPRGKPQPKTIPLPATWQSQFRSHTMRTGFCLALSQAMIEFLCAVADNVDWDRGQWHTIHRPDNIFASARALIKRGLIANKDESERRTTSQILQMPAEQLAEYSHWKLTPAGKAMVNLFKVTGLFVEADVAITKKARRG